MPLSGQTRKAACVKELVRRAAQNDEDAWDALLDRYSGLVWGIARSYSLPFHDAQDITQTVLCNLAEYLTRLRDPERLGSWLATVTHNECRRHLRIRGRVRPFPAEELDAPDHRTPESVRLVAEDVDRVRSALARLGSPESEVARLDLYRPGLPPTEVARLAGVPAKDLPRVRRRVRRRLHRLLKREEDR
ncbi:sigma-70 family RNA polymerase sigma factor [Thermobifida halotolerans]|uniref:Sigma-70 family RNA polymerase sigma factor n=1 Tax=Thermobifida halotolerans TaxID=483545 RepID=A0AA97LTK9_9ACTN|nr:sigma-70 family RNA polymerase sigma factor [Thermobifida halotolerans]UOE17820.1 sigma-70 family RNA polymerase sigma factor [Thermobifida halotolerans]